MTDVLTNITMALTIAAYTVASVKSFKSDQFLLEHLDLKYDNVRDNNMMEKKSE